MRIYIKDYETLKVQYGFKDDRLNTPYQLNEHMKQYCGQIFETNKLTQHGSAQIHGFFYSTGMYLILEE